MNLLSALAGVIFTLVVMVYFDLKKSRMCTLCGKNERYRKRPWCIECEQEWADKTGGNIYG